MVSEFNELFKESNADLPIQTTITVSTYMLWLLFSIPSFFGTYLLFFNKNRKGWLFVGFSVLSVLIILPFTVWSLYSPILEVTT